MAWVTFGKITHCDWLLTWQTVVNAKLHDVSRII